MFPSPIGELHFSIVAINSQWLTVKVFPSPIGELHFSMELLRNLVLTGQGVSVPYRGATFLNNGTPDVNDLFSASFRPLSGSYISQSIQPNGSGNGGYCFRPLSGSYISQFALNWKMVKMVEVCFRPLSGSYISQLWFYDFRRVNLYCFRPLSGSYISQSL